MTKSQIPPLKLWIKTDSLEIKFLQNIEVRLQGHDQLERTGMVHTLCLTIHLIYKHINTRILNIKFYPSCSWLCCMNPWFITASWWYEVGGGLVGLGSFQFSLGLTTN